MGRGQDAARRRGAGGLANHGVVIVHDPDQLAAVFAAAARGVVLTAFTAPWMAGAYGPHLLLEMTAQARAAEPQAEVTVVLDCDDDPAIALAALRTGWKHIAFTGTDSVRNKLAEIAAAHGAELLPPPTEAIDLADTDDIEAALSRA